MILGSVLYCLHPHKGHPGEVLSVPGYFRNGCLISGHILAKRQHPLLGKLFSIVTVHVLTFWTHDQCSVPIFCSSSCCIIVLNDQEWWDCSVGSSVRRCQLPQAKRVLGLWVPSHWVGVSYSHINLTWCQFYTNYAHLVKGHINISINLCIS